MKQTWVIVILVIVLVGCQQSEIKSATKHLDLQGEQDHKGYIILDDVQHESVVSDAFEEDREQANEEESIEIDLPNEQSDELTIDEADQIAKQVLQDNIETMEEVQETYYTEWFQLEEGSEQYEQALAIVQEALESTISQSALNKWTELYLKEFFIYQYTLAVLQPADLNILLNVEYESDAFTLNFIQLGDVAYRETTEYEVSFVKEGRWKFNGYEMERLDESLNLTFDDLKHAYVNVGTLERYEGTLVDEFEHEGDPYLVINFGPHDRAINLRTGVDRPDVLNQM
ncbi:hypothetical protein [Alkalibacillus haloalkaliphilus]|uniref:Lipoprotein n=1 Tax=Alkalibacillus haloalkaliphilus TaxID=94136 RepID=A0A511W453_9BACI|nr:hypothetical protein [Alkalibacillus haloalkaliphilus]GEN45541.1 hypothetical protein AHA02nite_13170 [Alkalibacillus haloalkaliphilus]